jgi:uncharacterized protein
MKYRLLPIIPILLLVSFSAAAQTKFPESQGFVNDFAGVVDATSAQRLTALCTELQQKTGAEMALVTLTSLDGGDVQDTANRLFEAWGIGRKEKNNGLLMLDAIEDRRIWIEVGYGLEGILPDGRVGSILDQYVIPYLKSGERGTGYLSGLSVAAQIIAADAGVTLDGTYAQPARRSSRGQNPGGFIPIVILLILFMILARRRRGSGIGGGWPWLFMGGPGGFGGGSGGGGFGGFGGGFGGFGGGFSGGGGAGRGY